MTPLVLVTALYLIQTPTQPPIRFSSEHDTECIAIYLAADRLAKATTIRPALPMPPNLVEIAKSANNYMKRFETVKASLVASKPDIDATALDKAAHDAGHAFYQIIVIDRAQYRTPDIGQNTKAIFAHLTACDLDYGFVPTASLP